MLSFDCSVVEDWFISHKNVSMALICVALALMGYRFILHESLVNNLVAAQRVNTMRQELISSKKLLVQQVAQLNKKRQQVNQLEKRREFDARVMLPALWLSHRLRQCNIGQYHFLENNHFPLGGQGRPIFNLNMQVNYSQALCVLMHFSRFSVGWKLSSMILSREADKPLLNMKFEMEMTP